MVVLEGRSTTWLKSVRMLSFGAWGVNVAASFVSAEASVSWEAFVAASIVVVVDIGVAVVALVPSKRLHATSGCARSAADKASSLELLSGSTFGVALGNTALPKIGPLDVDGTGGAGGCADKIQATSGSRILRGGIASPSHKRRCSSWRRRCTTNKAASKDALVVSMHWENGAGVAMEPSRRAL